MSVVRKALDDDNLSGIWNQVSERRRKMTPENLVRKRKPDLRLLIDQHDERILKALSDRMRSVKQMGELKANQDAPVYDPDRERRLLNARREWGRALGIPSDLIDELFEVIVRYSRQMQR